MQLDKLGYTAATGLPALEQAIAAHTERWYGIEVDPASVVVTTGSSGGFLAAFLAAFDAGDRVALARPGYPAYRNILAGLGCQVHRSGLRGRDRLRAHHRAAGGAAGQAGRAHPGLAGQPDRRHDRCRPAAASSRPGATNMRAAGVG